jgi:hypothetical protein
MQSRTLEQHFQAISGEVARMPEAVRNSLCATPMDAILAVAYMLAKPMPPSMQSRLVESLQTMRVYVDEMQQLRDQAQEAVRDIAAAREAIKQDPIVDDSQQQQSAKRPRGRPSKKFMAALAVASLSQQQLPPPSPLPCHDDAPSTPLPPTLLPNSPVY